jgi:hypothetical protein
MTSRFVRVILMQVAMQACEYNWSFFALLLGTLEFQLSVTSEEFHSHCTFLGVACIPFENLRKQGGINRGVASIPHDSN